MMKYIKKHISLIIVISIFLVFPVSLSNQAKLNMRIIVTGLAIDVSDGKYEVTAQIVRNSPNSVSKGGGAEIDFISSSAETVSKALSGLMYKAGKVSAFSHTNFVIVGSDFQKEDVSKFLDIFLRDKVIKNSALLLFSEGSAKSEIKKTKNLGLSVGLGLQKVFTFKQEECNGLMTTILDFMVKSKDYGKTSAVGSIAFESSEKTEEKKSEKGQENQQQGQSGEQSQSSGGGDSSSSKGEEKQNFKSDAPILFFRGGRYICKTETGDELLAYYLTLKKSKTAFIVIDNPQNGELDCEKITIIIKNKVVRKKIRFENQVPCLDICIKINNSEINEIISEKNVFDFSYNNYQIIKDTIAKKISEDVGNLFEKTKDNGLDIFGAYEMAFKFKPKTLKKYYENEDEFISALKLNIKVDITKLDN